MRDLGVGGGGREALDCEAPGGVSRKHGNEHRTLGVETLVIVHEDTLLATRRNVCCTYHPSLQRAAQVFVNRYIIIRSVSFRSSRWSHTTRTRKPQHPTPSMRSVTDSHRLQLPAFCSESVFDGHRTNFGSRVFLHVHAPFAGSPPNSNRKHGGLF